jgi:hypothetical protein
MAPKLIRSLSVLASVLVPLIALPVLRAHADDGSWPGTSLPSLSSFASLVNDGHAGELRGVYAPGVFADAVVQQPGNDANFVATQPGVVTQFRPASSIGSTGLLAHNFLAGQQFPLLTRGDLIYLVYGDGYQAPYIVTQTLQYQALDPESPYSNFVDLSNGNLMSASYLFSAAYGRPGDLVLQTCIDANGNPSWGRLFIVAEPYVGQPFAVRPDTERASVMAPHMR